MKTFLAYGVAVNSFIAALTFSEIKLDGIIVG